MGKTILITNAKGGVGKTAATYAIAYNLAERGKKVLLVDLDQQRNLTMSFLSGEQLKEIKCTSQGIIENFLKGQPAEDQSQIFITVAPNISLIPSASTIEELNGYLFHIKNKFQDDIRFATVLKRILRGSTFKQFDYIFIDASSSPDLLKVNTMVASDYIFIPVLLEEDSYKGAILVTNFISKTVTKLNPSAKINGIFFNMYNPRTRLAKIVESWFEERFCGLLMKTKIRKNVALAEAKCMRKSLKEYNPECNAAADFAALTGEILNIINKQL